MPRRNRTPRRRQASRYSRDQVDELPTNLSQLDSSDFDRMARRLVEQGKTSTAVLEGVYGTPRARQGTTGSHPGGRSKVERGSEMLTRSHEKSPLSIRNGRFSGGGGR